MITNGNSEAREHFKNRPALDLGEMERDPAFNIRGMPPGYGEFPLPHISTFSGIHSTASKVYLPSDEALRNSRNNAVFMRNDPGIMECLNARQLSSALLPWQIIPEDDTSSEQKELCAELTKIVKKIRRFTEYRMNLLHAIWYGKYGIQHSYKWGTVAGKRRVYPKGHRAGQYGWKPIDGDKLVFRYDDGTGQFEEDQLGIRISNSKFTAGDLLMDGRYRAEKISSTSQGLAYFLDWHERDRIAIHKHSIEDAPWEQGYIAGNIHGVGVRSRIYWEWMQKQELLGFLIEYLERSAGGIEVWSYPQGNPQAEAQVKSAAMERVAHGRNIMFLPKPLGEDASSYDVNFMEPGMAGIDSVERILSEYFGHRIKRYILGQTLSSEATATGMGSGLADLHMDTFFQIITYDALNLEETITHELIDPLKRWNFPSANHFDVQFKITLESPNVEEQLQAWKTVWDMGAKIKTQEVMELVGASIPTGEDDVLENPQAGQAGMMGGMPGGMPGEQPGDQSNQLLSNLTKADSEQDQGEPATLTDELNDEFMRQMFGEPQDGDAVTYAAEDGKWVQRELPFDTGERERVGEYSKSGHDSHEFSSTQVNLAGEPDRYAKSDDGRWITINSNEDGEGGTPVQLDESGNIAKGPKELKGKSISDLDKKSQETGKALDYQGKRKKSDPHPLHSALLQANQDTGFTMRELRQAVDDEWSIMGDHLSERETAKAQARKLTGLNSSNIGKIENSLKDHSTRAKFDTDARSIASEFPSLGIDPDNAAEDVWELIREGKSNVKKHSPEIINAAVQRLQDEKRRKDKAKQRERERIARELESVPFSRRNRYAKEWSEGDHNRDKDGRFTENAADQAISENRDSLARLLMESSRKSKGKREFYEDALNDFRDDLPPAVQEILAQWDLLSERSTLSKSERVEEWAESYFTSADAASHARDNLAGQIKASVRLEDIRSLWGEESMSYWLDGVLADDAWTGFTDDERSVIESAEGSSQIPPAIQGKLLGVIHENAEMIANSTIEGRDLYEEMQDVYQSFNIPLSDQGQAGLKRAKAKPPTYEQLKANGLKSPELRKTLDEIVSQDYASLADDELKDEIVNDYELWDIEKDSERLAKWIQRKTRRTNVEKDTSSRRSRVEKVNRMARRFSGEGKILFSRALSESRESGTLRSQLRMSYQRARTGQARAEIRVVESTLYRSAVYPTV